MNKFPLDYAKYTSNFFNQHKDLYEIISKNSVGIENAISLYKMSQNCFMTEFIYVGMSNYKKYFSLSYALNESKKSDIIFKIKELDVFIIFENMKAYNVFILDYEDKLRTHLNIQVRLITEAATLLFRTECDFDNFVLIKNHCRRLFHHPIPESVLEDIRYTKEYMVDTSSINLWSIKKEIENLDKFMYESEFVSANNCVNLVKNSELLELINKCIDKNIPLVLNINISGDNSSIANSINESISPKERLAKEWVSKNLPNDGDSSSELYEKYRNNHPNKCISLGTFTALIKENGYENLRDGKSIHRWYKK